MRTTNKIITFILLFFVFAASGCTLFNKTETTKNEKYERGEIIIYDEVAGAAIDFEIIEKNTYYYPTLSGKVIFDFYPEKITLSACGEEYEVKASEIKTLQEKYIFTFENQEIIFNHIFEGEYDVKIYGYKGDEKATSPTTTKFSVDDEYFGTSLIDFGSGKMSLAMDKESNWIGPY